MTVNTVNITSGPYTGNGASDQYSYTFRVKDKTQLSVYETDDAGVRTLLTVDTDYTVANIGDAAGGIITRVAGNLPTDYVWYIRSNYIEDQLTAFSSQGAFFPGIHEDQFDHITFLIQQILDTRARSFRLSDEVDLDGDFTIDDDAATRASKLLGFDSNGDAVVVAGDLTSVSVSAYMATVILAANAAAARTLLDAASLTVGNTFTAAQIFSALATFTGNAKFNGASPIIFEGATDDAFETTLAIEDPTADRTLTVQDKTGTMALLSDTYVFNSIEGLTISNDTDTDHDINITAGGAIDSVNSQLLTLGTEITKQIDATWATGDDAGGLFTGSVAIDTWYHVFLIEKDSDGSIDAGFDTSVTAANIPAGYTAYRRLGSVLTDGTANILQFYQNGNEFLWSGAALDISSNNPGTAAVLRTMSVPVDVRVKAFIIGSLQNLGTSISSAYLTSPDALDQVSAYSTRSNTGMARTLTNYATNQGIDAEIWTNTSSQIRSRLEASDANITVSLTTTGWLDNRGQI